MSDGYDVNFTNPLEVHLERLTKRENAHNDFPHCGLNRFELYKLIKSQMNEKYYRDVDGGLTADSGGGAYTRHDLEHVNDVIRRAGHLLGASSSANTPSLESLYPYEIFVLLVACLIHDAGNVSGRMGHASKARKVLREVCGEYLEEKEIRIISKVAKAHGGKAQDGSKDTIRDLPDIDGVQDCRVRSQILAAILRYADELAENSRRANTRDVPSSRFPNAFCKCISINVDYQNRRVGLDFAISEKECELFGVDEKNNEMYFIDYIKKRVLKAEMERRYCDQFLRGLATYSETRVTIEFLHNDLEWRQPIDFRLNTDGYPTEAQVNILQHDLDGSKIAALYAEYKKKMNGERND